MYELVRLINFALKKSGEGKQLAVATIIHTVGSTYRKKGTQMIVAEDLTYEGAISGGCVENEVLRNCEQVFSNKENIMFEYDGRYKLGCNGVIYILLEYLDRSVLSIISEKVMDHCQKRKHFHLGLQKDNPLTKASVYFSFDNEKLYLSQPGQCDSYIDIEELDVKPQYQLIIIGGEHDSVVLANLADQAGITTWLITKESFLYKPRNTVKVAYLKPETLSAAIRFDEQTAIVLMTHSLSRDLSYLVEVLQVKSAYLGILGPESRKETILNDLLSYNENLFLRYQDKLQDLRGPVGLMIGAKTPEEISVSILSEIIGIFSHQAAHDP